MKLNKITKVLFGIYIVLLTWIIIFKLQIGFPVSGFRSINLIPFAESLIINDKISFSEIILNILVFVPFGIYLSMLAPNTSFFKKVLPMFLTSLSYEVAQYIFAVGASDITDLIGNTLGGIIGILLYWCLEKWWKEKTNQIVTGLACMVTIGVVGLISAVLVVDL